MKEEPELPTEYELEHNGEKLKLYWDGFCFCIESEKFAFIASVNDPTISPFGNLSAVFGTAEEIAQRLG